MLSGSTSATSRPPTRSGPEPRSARGSRRQPDRHPRRPGVRRLRQPLDEPTRGAVCSRCWDAIVPFTPPLCAHCGDPLPSWRVISIETSRCPRCRRRGSALSQCAPSAPTMARSARIVHALKYGGRPIDRTAAGWLMSGSSGDVTSRRRSRGAGAAASTAAPRARLQSGRGTGAASRASVGGRPAAHARHTLADRSAGRAPARQRPRTHSRCAGGPPSRVVACCSWTMSARPGRRSRPARASLREAGASDVRALTAARVASRPP